MQLQAAACTPAEMPAQAIERRMQVAAIGVDLEQFPLRQVVAPDSIWRQHRIEFGDRAQHVGNEGV